MATRVTKDNVNWSRVRVGIGSTSDTDQPYTN